MGHPPVIHQALAEKSWREAICKVNDHLFNQILEKESEENSQQSYNKNQQIKESFNFAKKWGLAPLKHGG